MSDIEYDEFDFTQFTAEDFEEIDVAVRSALRNFGSIPAPTSRASDVLKRANATGTTGGDSGGPGIPIELEEHSADDPELCGLFKASDTDEFKSNDKPQKSPYRTFRRKNLLSVTDLVAPAWCEVQFDYGLRQRRSFKIETRPTTFVSPQGREIAVNSKVARKNERVLKVGRSVHKDLEREIKPVEIVVYTTTEEERWALRLVNMLAAVESLMTLGFAREIPVFGIVHDQLIVGVIDELRREQKLKDSQPVNGMVKKQPYARKLGKKINKTGEPEVSRPTIASFFATSHHEREESKQSSSSLSLLPTHTLHLSDTKTRRTLSVPPYEDTLPSRLQLMLYHRLLSPLVSSAFNFRNLWNRLGLRSHAHFREKFKADAFLILSGNEHEMKIECLDDLTSAWADAVRRLDVDGVAKHLKLSYRTRPSSNSRKRKHKQSGESAIAVMVDLEEQDVAAAVEASLKDIDQLVDEDIQRASLRDIDQLVDEDIQRAIEASLEGSKGHADVLTESEELIGLQAVKEDAWVAQESLLTDAPSGINTKTDPSFLPSLENDAVKADTDDSPGEDSQVDNDTASTCASSQGETSDSHIIGVKYVEVDDVLLDTHLKEVLEWWYGRRPPKGVGVEQTGRCFSCEYRDGCEWREQKAREVLETRAFSDVTEKYV